MEMDTTSHYNILQRLRRNIKCEKGMAMFMFFFYIPIALILIALVVDYGNILLTKHQVQSIADAGSLAGASQATAVRDEHGNVVVAIDEVTGELEVLETIQRNVDELGFNYNGVNTGSKVSITDVDITFLNANQQVRVEITYELKTILINQIVKIFDSSEDFSTITTKEYAIAQVG